MTKKDKKKFAKVDTYWSYKGKFAINKEEVAHLNRNKDYINAKIKKGLEC